MIAQIHIISCEHQSYRRAAQVVMLEYFGYDLDKVEVIWGLHLDYHSIDKVMQSFADMGVDRVKNITLKHPTRHYGLSAQEAHVRSLTRIIETQKNTIVLEDDHYLIMPHGELYRKLENLEEVANIGVVQLQNRGKYNDVPRKPVAGATDFMRGSCRSSHTALFITPYGAEKLLDFMRTGKEFSMENGLPGELRNEPWVFSTLNPRQFIFSSKHIQGRGIGHLYTLHGVTHRRTYKSMQEDDEVIDKFRL